MYIKQLTIKIWINETIWITVRPEKLPRDITHIAIACVYHPPQANHRDLKDHLSRGFDTILSKHPGAGIAAIGDFNQFPDINLTSQHGLKQLVKASTRENSTLDKCYTNMHHYYENPQIRSHLGKSDHNAVLLTPNKYTRQNNGVLKSRITRIQGKNEKSMFVYKLRNTDWSDLYLKDTCEEQFSVFNQTMSDLIDSCFPLKKVVYHTNDKPWVTEYFKDLVTRRQRRQEDKALLSGHRQEYNRLRSTINRLSKKLKPVFYNSKVKHLSSTDTKKWWSHVKSLIGLNKTGSADAMHVLANGTTNGNVPELAERINTFLQSVTSDIPPLSKDKYTQIPTAPSTPFTISVEEVELNLTKIKISKAAGPDGIQAWMLRDLAPLLAKPIAAIYNSSIREGHVPGQWKHAYICPLPKKNPPKIIEKDIRPISLTPLLAKELERFVAKWIREQTTSDDPLQFGNRQKVSTTHMLVELIHTWAKALDEGKRVQTVYLDFTKAFDKINHTILMSKYEKDGIDPALLKWLASFLSERQQCVKIDHHISSILTINGAVPQGAILGLEAFCRMIKDMRSSLPIYKFVDDSTISEVLPKKPEESRLQSAIDDTVQWTKDNGMHINAAKTYEMVIAGRTKTEDIPQIVIDNNPIERVEVTKLVGVYIQSNLKWDKQVDSMIAKARPKLYFLVALKKSRLTTKDLLTFYISIVRSQLEYAVPVFATSLTSSLIERLESVQKRAMHIIFPDLSYADALKTANIVSLQQRRMDICERFFRNMQKPNNILAHLLPTRRQTRYNMRSQRKYEIPKCKTNRFKNTLIPYGLLNFQ